MTPPDIAPETLLLKAPAPAPLLPTDTCDHRVCGPAVTANVAVRLITGGLLTFCHHHYNENAIGLVELIVGITKNEVH